MRCKHIILICFVSITRLACGQNIVDTCFTSAEAQGNFFSSGDLANMGGFEADLLEWTGTAWIGLIPSSLLTIPPPTNEAGCRAIFIGNAITWTTPGEGFRMRLDAPLVAGETYSIDFTYVSHGVGSDGSFSPAIHLTSSTALGDFVGNLPPVGNTWTTNTFTFTATAAHNWIVVTTTPDESSGIINSFCDVCNNTPVNCSVNLGNDTTLCAGSELILNATTSNATYQWQDNSTNPTYTVSEPGTYWVTITADNCIASDTIHVSYNSLPELGNDTTLCAGEMIVLDATALDANYQWQDNSSNATFTVTQPGTYWVTITADNCSASDTIHVSYSLLFDLGNDTTLCAGESITLDATTSDADYQWQDNSSNPTFTVSQPGNYWVTLTLNDCTSADTIVVGYNPIPAINIGNDTTVCQGEDLILNATTVNATYQWQNNSANPTFAVSQFGTYWVTITVNNCSATDSINVSYNPIPLIDLGVDTTLCEGVSITLDATLPNALYLWQDNSTDPIYSATQEGVYWVEVTVNNCSSIGTIVISSINCEVILDMPNVFTPNNDGRNDYFGPIRMEGIVDVTMTIFNRWGQKLFETTNALAGWNGTFNGEICSEGTYFWTLHYSDITGQSNNKTGYVSLLR